MSITPRYYQQEAVNAIFDYFTNDRGNPLVVLPTGTGKSLVIAMFVYEALNKWPGQRILCVTHVKELIEQNYNELKSLWPMAPAGIYSAGLNQRNLSESITFAGVKSIYHRTKEIGKIDLVVVDEAHLIPRKSTTMYRELLDNLRKINPKLKVIGLTATPYRLDSGRLDRGPGALFSKIIYNAKVDRMIDEGYLSDLITARAENTLSVEGAKVIGGDWSLKDLSSINDRTDINVRVVNEILKHAADRKKLLIFALSVEHANHITSLLAERGCKAHAVFGSTSREERDSLISAFRSGAYRALVNVNVLTTGFNVPDVDCVVLLRPTKSVGLYIQAVGRGMRVAPNKKNCLVLDFGGNVDRHGPINDLKTVAKNKRPAPAILKPGLKLCPACHASLPNAVHICYECGHVFTKDETEVDLETTPTFSEIIRRGLEQQKIQGAWYEVSDIHITPHIGKTSGKRSVRIVYETPSGERYSDYLCFGYDGYPGRRAREWWEKVVGYHSQPPESVDSALRRKSEIYNRICAIRVIKDGQYDKIAEMRVR